MRRHRRAVIGAIAMGAVGSGCNLILGISDFTDQQATTLGGGGDASTTASSGGGEGAGGIGGASAANGTGGTGTGGMGVCQPGSTAPCYSGPEGTEGVGLCKAGSKTCLGDGSGYGACEGEVLPASEVCAQGGDEDCDGRACGETEWAQQFGDASYQSGQRIAVDDATGDIYIAGKVSGAIQFGPDTFVDSGNGGVYLAKFDPSGKYLWGKQFDAAMNVWGLAVDTSGNVIIGGQGDFGGNTSIMKFDAGGSLVWSTAFAFSNAAIPFTDITVTAQDELVIVGSFTGTKTYGGITLTSAGETDIFVAKLSGTDGSVKWAKRYGDSKPQSATDVATDPSGNIYLTGDSYGTMQFDSVSVLGSADGRGYAVKLTPDGVGAKAITLGDQGSTIVYGLAVNTLGELVVAGSYTGSITPPGGIGTLVNPDINGGHGFLIMFKNTGLASWMMDIGQSFPVRLAIDNSNDVLAVTRLYGTGTFMGIGLVSAGKYDVAVAKLAGSTGEPRWARSFGDAQDQAPTDIAAGNQNEALVVGTFTSTLVFDDAKLSTTGQGNSDVFLVKIAP